MFVKKADQHSKKSDKFNKPKIEKLNCVSLSFRIWYLIFAMSSILTAKLSKTPNR